MALNPSIILAGKGPDIVGAMRGGNALAGEVNQLRSQNALRDLYRTQGADIMAGKQPALNALAGIDPAAALGIQDARLGMDARRLDMSATQQRMDMLTREEQRQLAEIKAKATEAEKQALIEQTKKEMFRFISAPTPEIFDQMVTQAGRPDLVGQWQARATLGAAYVSSVEEALKLSQGPEQPAWRAATKEEASARGAAAGQINDKTGEFKAINPPSGMSIQTNPDGTMSFTQGPGAAKPFTEAQSKDNVFATRAKGALDQLEPVADALVSRVDRVAEYIPLGLGREVQSDQFQLAKQAGDEFLQAILRKDTGAAITPQEQELYGVTLLPQPGDRDAVLEAKRQSRARAVRAIEAGMSADQIIATEKALVDAVRASERPTQPTTPAAPQSTPQATPSGNAGGVNWKVVQ